MSEELSGSELLDKFLEQEKIRFFEGSTGVKNLETVVGALGYGKGFMRNRSIEDFLTDNPGAIEAILEFIREWMDRGTDWKEKLESHVEEDEDEEEEEKTP